MANICSVPKSGALPIYIRTCVPIYFLYNCLLLYFAPFLFGKCFEIKISFRQRGKAHFQIFTLPQQQWKANAMVCSGPRWFSSLFQRWRHQFKNVQLIRSRSREHGAGNVSASPVSFPAARFPLISRQAGKVIVFAGCSLFWGDTPTRRIHPLPRPQHTKFALCRMRLRIYFRLDCVISVILARAAYTQFVKVRGRKFAPRKLCALKENDIKHNWSYCFSFFHLIRMGYIYIYIIKYFILN